jgi:mycoredoxin
VTGAAGRGTGGGNERATSRVCADVPFTDPLPSPGVIVYWRPGCPYCSRLRRGLRRAGLPVHEVDIWADRSAAATVRALAGGNETVPTVVVGETSLVNPSAAEVLAAANRAGITAGAPAPDGSRPSLVTLLAGLQWSSVVGLLAASYWIESRGHTAVSWLLDAAAVTAYVGVRMLRRRLDAPRRS